MKFTPNFTSIELDMPAYKRALYQYLIASLRGGGRKWLDATVRTSTHIPTWSGASRATFQKLAQELGTTVPIGPIRAHKDRTALGRASAQGSGMFVDESKGLWQFVYQTQLRYLAYNEYNRAVAGAPPQPFSNNVRYTPYGFQAKGAKAWLAFTSKLLLPSPFKYLRKGKL